MCDSALGRDHIVIDFEAGYSEPESFAGFTTPIPPNLEGKASRSRSLSLGGVSQLEQG